MKDATGELSMTAVAVVAIAAIAVLFTTLVWPTIKTNILRSTYCGSAFNCSCPTGSTKGSSSMCSCYYCPTDSGSNSASSVNCQNPQPISCNKDSN